MPQKIKVGYKKLSPDAILPSYGTELAAGADIYALCDGEVEIAPGQTLLIHTGIAMAIPEGMVGLIYARSGLASKKGLAPANNVGVIDSDYRAEIMVALHNHSDQPATVSTGDRIAQLVIAPYYTAEFEESDLGTTERGAGGFGSTGK
jgi:dUTP pyrophosphatase